MKVADLLTGIAVVIDDEIDDNTARIRNLISQIKKKNMPYLAYKELPDESTIDHFEGISFLLLDWVLHEEDIHGAIPNGVTAPSTLRESDIEQNVSFIKKLREKCFIPIFIFTNEQEDIVIETLKVNGLYQEDKPNYIFVKRKVDLIGRTKLFNTITEWIQKTPSIYVLEGWEKVYRTSKVKLFHDFYNMSPNWPNILWESFAADGVNRSLELGEVITRNLYTRMVPFAFDDKILKKKRKPVPKDEVRKVIAGACFIKEDCLQKDAIATGDIFKNSPDKFFINIRPDCDCIQDRKGAAETSGDVDLYLLRGNKLTSKQEGKAYRPKYGNFVEMDNQSIVFNIIDGKTYNFKFKDLTINKWSEIKDKRVGRLLPPYITRIQQRYALYLQRQGLPRTPKQAILGS